jgi:hypothetical protein
LPNNFLPHCSGEIKKKHNIGPCSPLAVGGVGGQLLDEVDEDVAALAALPIGQHLRGPDRVDQLITYLNET